MIGDVSGQIAQSIGAVYMYLAGTLSPVFVSDVVKTLLGSFAGAGLAFFFALQKDQRSTLREHKAAGNMATLTLGRLGNDFLQVRTYLVEYQRYINKQQPNSPLWMQLKAMHFNFAAVRFDLPSLVYLMEQKGGAEVVEQLITVEMKCHDFFRQLEEHQAANYELQKKLSDSGLDPYVGAPIREINKAAGFALIAKVESFVKGINDHLQYTEPAIRQAAVALPQLMVRTFRDKGTIKLELPSHEALVKSLGIKFP
jgi:hypothetical protein